jgi:hypothetical protein
MADTNPLGDSLQKLRAELRSLPISDEASRRRLDALIQDIAQTVDPSSRRHTDATLVARLNATLLGLEASHPRIAAILNEVMQELGNMGI